MKIKFSLTLKVSNFNVAQVRANVDIFHKSLTKNYLSAHKQITGPWFQIVRTLIRGCKLSDSKTLHCRTNNNTKSTLSSLFLSC